jgi:hypothetical protein
MALPGGIAMPVREDKDSQVQRVNEYRFYELGQKIRSIQDIKDDTEYRTVWYQLWEARNALIELKDDPVSMRVSLSVVDRMIAAISEIVPMDQGAFTAKLRESQGSPATIVGVPYYELTDALRAFEPVLAAECKALDTYVVSQKRGYSTPDLVERAHIMLSDDSVAILPDGVIADIQAAGRCLAFDVPTASGFHILRAVEAVMALYYTHLTGADLKKQNRNWGLYLKKLKDVPQHDPKISGALDHIRDNYRNPISHPEDTLTEAHAIMLFGLCLSSIELMAETLRNTTPALTEADQLKALTEIAEQNASESENF